jgi:hypothetical protein
MHQFRIFAAQMPDRGFSHGSYCSTLPACSPLCLRAILPL